MVLLMNVEIIQPVKKINLKSKTNISKIIKVNNNEFYIETNDPRIKSIVRRINMIEEKLNWLEERIQEQDVRIEYLESKQENN